VPVIHRSALVPLPASALFTIVDDVARYPEFLPWCAGAEVLEQREGELVAELELAGRGIRERFTTRNLRFPHDRIELQLVSGPFRRFSGVWTFTRLGAGRLGADPLGAGQPGISGLPADAGCKVELALDFEFAGARALLGSAFGGIFVKAADRMVDAFCLRARALHP
jgi:ribosome-associated toxin RatA of RatAB toxin-antitoxin module